jgi:hypothetical protein
MDRISLMLEGRKNTPTIVLRIRIDRTAEACPALSIREKSDA